MRLNCKAMAMYITYLHFCVFQSSGYVVESTKRFVPSTANLDQVSNERIKGNSICNCCTRTINDPRHELDTLVVYQCAHQFHSSCLTELQKATGYNRCPPCMDMNYIAIREERERSEKL